MQHQLLQQVLTALDNDNSSTLYELVLQTLRSQDLAHQRHRASLLSCIPDVLDLSEQSTITREGLQGITRTSNSVRQALNKKYLVVLGT
jgi:hypothetical protein